MNTLKEIAGVLAVSLSTACLGMAGLPGDWRTRETPVTTHLTAVASAPGHLVAVGHAATILTSVDGNSWYASSYAGSGDFHCVTFGKGMYVAGGTFDCFLAISPDGFNWTNIQATLGQQTYFGVTYGPGRFVAVGRGGLQIPTRIFTSTNGIDWQPASVPPTTNTLRAVTFGNGKYVAVGERGTILTSADATTWTLQISGTEHLLRSVIFTGREFLAGGDSSTLLTSGDGLTWVTVPFSSFDVRGLATSGTAVVGVGALGAEGRAQSSTDGLSWTGGAQPFANRVNGVVQFDLGRFIAVGNNGLVVDTAAWADTPINIWTNNASGLWHDPYWSLGHIPSWKDQLIVFTNAGTKTLEINAVTTRDYPGSMQINQLVFHGPEGSHNTLLMNGAGHDVPLLINGQLYINPNTSLLCYESSLEVPMLIVSGEAVFGNQTRVRVRGSAHIGSLAPVRVLQSGATVSIANCMVGVNHTSVWEQIAGLHELETLNVGSNGTYRLLDGLLSVANTITLSGKLQLDGGSVSNSMLQVADGVIEASGNYELGKLSLSGHGLIRYSSSNSTLRFANSSDQSWNGMLLLTNWVEGTHHLFIGHDQTGLTAAQVSRIRFVNPAGLSPGIYSARITPTGEVVPVPRLINYQRSASHLVLNWPEGYRLWTATNVAGPYSLITNTISPYTASYHTDPQRFFILRNEN